MRIQSGAGSGTATGFQFDGIRIECQDCGSLVGVPDELSLSSGGTQNLALEAGSAFAGLPYLLLGSVSGTDPGFPVDGLTLPLNVDAYTLLVLNNPNTPPLGASFGTLDALGSAAATFTLPAGTSPALAGTVVHHAYAVLQLVPGLQVVFVSDAEPVVLAP